MSKRAAPFAAFLFLLIAIPATSNASEWFVDASVSSPGDGTTWETAFKAIQDGIDVALEGDTVNVAEGSYVENILFKGKNIVLRSSGHDGKIAASTTIIDGGGSGSVVTFKGTEDETCVLAGFTIRNGEGSDGGGICGGTHNNSTRATIRNNVITGNSGGYGGGIAFCEGIIENNTICSNEATRAGGAFYGRWGVIRNCIIWDNTAPRHAQIDVFGEPTYSCIQHWKDSGLGNIPHHPYFVDAANGDFHLRSRSPCIDAGDPSSPFSKETPPNGGRVNMGAFGNTTEAASASPDTDRDGLPDDWERDFFSDLAARASDDTDGDGRANLQEYHHNTDPTWFRTWYIDGTGAPSGDGTTWATAFQRIQEGIDAASDTDTVIVAAGTYVENIHLHGKNITLRSVDPTDPAIADKTIIDGNDSGSVVTFAGTEDETCVLSGFTIRNGNAEDGGGILGEGTGALIQNNIVTGNHAERGGGIYGCLGPIQHNDIISNRARYGGGGIYGGIIRNNLIADNVAAHGGGIYGGTIIRNNTIKGNTAKGLAFSEGWPPTYYYHDAEGGAVCACVGTIENNVISRNTVRASSPGISCYGGGLYRCDGTIQNNLIHNNSGQGLYRCSGAIQNNTIVSNGYYGLYGCDGSIRNCIVWGNHPEVVGLNKPSYCCIMDWTEGGEGNITSDPMFVDDDGPDNDPSTVEDNDYRLQSDSPCVDAGINFYWFAWPQDDLDGNCRLARHRVDMGCYEFESSQDSDGDLLSDDDETAAETDPTCYDTDSDGLRDGLEILRGSDPLVPTSPGILRVRSDVPTIQAALCLALDGEEIVVFPGIYQENLHLCGPDVVLRSINPQSPAVQAETILDGREQGPVVWFTGNESEACALRGFTIRNGRTNNGGGICGGTLSVHTHATIEGNLVTENVAGAWDLQDPGGGGIAFCDGPIRNNKICGNTSYSIGGGLADCDGSILSNLVTHNRSLEGGGLVYCSGSIVNNTISHNIGTSYGGGLSRCSGQILNNIIAFNLAHRQLGSAYGGGLYKCGGTIEMCLIWGNSAPYGPDAYGCSALLNCILRDPHFANPYGPDGDPDSYQDNDYRPALDSPCIDAGLNEEWMSGALDLDSNPRIWNSTVDMGAYEYGSFPFRITRVLPALIWNSRPGDYYTVWSCVDLGSGIWKEEAVVSSDGVSTTWTDFHRKSRCKFYRIECQ